MDIRGDKGYLTIPEQIGSELSSPIDIGAIDVIRCLKGATTMALVSREAIDADHSEGLPHDRARALRDCGVATAQAEIYRQIATELMLRGKLDTSAIETIR